MENDLISRQATMVVIENSGLDDDSKDTVVRVLEQLPSAELEIIYCKDCRKHNNGINEAPYLADRCPLILHRGYAHGHEYDYQFCVYAERRTDK